MENIKKTIKEKILAQIERGKVAVKPRWKFIVAATFACFGGIAAFLLALGIVSFVFFAINENGLWFAPRFGMHGVFEFFGSLPWLLVFAAVISMVAIEFFAKKYAIGYRTPIIYSVAAIIAVVGVGSFLIIKSGAHNFMWKFSENSDIPLMVPFYRNYAQQRLQNIHPMMVSTTTKDGFFARDKFGDDVRVFMHKGTNLPEGPFFEPGDEVIIFGERNEKPEGTILDAKGISPRCYLCTQK